MIAGNNRLATAIEIDSSRERLLYLAQHGLWTELEQKAVSFKQNGSPISIFNDDVWNFAPYKVGTEIALLNFQFPDGAMYPRLVQELKVVALAYIYHSRHAYRIGTIRSKIDCLKRLAISLYQNEI
ncbi:site-specific integrase, partial [Escherichia coli]